MGGSPSVPQNQFMNSQSRVTGVRIQTSVFKKGKFFWCGYTDSIYTQLTELYNKYKDQGFEIFAFPCNQFLKQEPGMSQDAQEFVCTRYKAQYPIFQKFSQSNASGFLGSRIKWNFTKFLVDKEGKVIGRYSPTTTPLAIKADIKRFL